MAPPRRSPEHEFKSAPPPAATSAGEHEPPSRIIDNLSPPLIAMFAVIGIAFLIVVYARLLSRQIRRLRRRWRRWRRCRHLLRSAAIESQFSPPPPAYAAPFPFSSDSYSDHVLSPYGLDDAAIKTLPLSIFSKSKAKQPASTNRDCAVCLFEFEDGEWLRTLPICSHAFHIECIDVWLRSHPTCPLCRAAISFRSESPFIPMRAARIRPSFDDIVLEHPAAIDPASPISEERGRGFPLKRSYSFGFERSVGAERMVMEITAAATVSPAWGLRHQQHQGNHHQHRGFWSKRWASPFGSGGGSARPYYNRRSPFVRRWGFVPLSGGGGGAVGSSTAAIGGRRSRSMTSPSAMGMGRALGFSSSRMRCGDPEALISPERFNRR
ncbi:RING-H2 finger protein ATL65 [Phalaenopsis equestris]|uniref:RING-H2 finger protein ATL65 n=1 Tax=Phalaenopsis equestris TaxID=78828 RepID=UPI0009E3088E|nr:RING-H2 finger protein ATL65 [Phalaenopsis equestris]